MEQLVNFIVWTFTAIGSTIIVTNGNIFKPVRDKLGSMNKYLGMLLHCPMCLIFWASIGVSLLTHSPTGNLFLDGCLGSGLWFYITFGTQMPQQQQPPHMHNPMPMPQTPPKKPTKPKTQSPKK